MRNIRTLPKVFLLTVISVLLTSVFLVAQSAYAGNLTQISDTLSRIQVSTEADHTIRFNTPTGVDAPGETIVLAFHEESPSFGLSSVTYADIDLKYDGAGFCDGMLAEETLAATAGVGTWGVSVNNVAGTITLTAPTDAAADQIPAGSCVLVLIGTHAVSGTNGIINPSIAGTYTLGISGTFGDTGTAAINIVSDDQIDITASVDPTLDVVISSNACGLGTLSASVIKTCSYNVTVSTNATSGYISTIVSDGNLRNAVDSITNASGGTVARGSEEYGVGTSKAGQTIVQNTACTDGDTGASQPATALSTLPQQFADSAGPVSTDATTVCHLASVSGATPAGSYSQVATIIVTSNF